MTEISDLATGDTYTNLSHDGSLRVSISEKHNEILVYRDGQDEPEARFSLETGELLDR